GPGSIAITTAPTDRQVKRLLWREIRMGFHASQGFIGGELFDQRLTLADDWFALGLSTDDPESFSGWHEERVLVVVDEASGVSEGEGSLLWQVRVCGEFAQQGDDAVCPLVEVETAQARELEPGEPSVVACDVARFGSDETVIVVRRGPRVRIAKSYSGRDTM